MDVPAGEGDGDDRWSICRELGGFKPIQNWDSGSCGNPPLPVCVQTTGFCPGSVNVAYSGITLSGDTCQIGRIPIPCSDETFQGRWNTTVFPAPSGIIPRGVASPFGSCCFGRMEGFTSHLIDTSGGYCARFDEQYAISNTCDERARIDNLCQQTMVTLRVGAFDSSATVFLNFGVKALTDAFCRGPISDRPVGDCGYYPDAYNFISEGTGYWRYSQNLFGCTADFLAGYPLVWENRQGEINVNLPAVCLQLHVAADARIEVRL